ncbi:fasciclin domain-containing protein [Acetobacteraceae bacterium H6797]|nr:fasciclin domain-containing protein [Acetobacteraceae bacterium H6797]
MITRRMALGAVALLATPAVLRAQTVPSAPDLANRLAASPDFSKFIALAQQAGVMDQLRGTQPLTVFAPTNAALDSIPNFILQELTGRDSRDSAPDPVRLSALVTHHLLAGNHMITEFMGKVQDLPSRNGGLIRINGTGSVVTVAVAAPEGGARSNFGTGVGGYNVQPPAEVVRADIIASNGVIHAINGVMLP